MLEDVWGLARSIFDMQYWYAGEVRLVHVCGLSEIACVAALTPIIPIADEAGACIAVGVICGLQYIIEEWTTICGSAGEIVLKVYLQRLPLPYPPVVVLPACG
jgi:hypothetical protein